MRYYLVGIKGAGMSALAQLLRARGNDVEGSDVSQQFFSDILLAKSGIVVHEGFNALNLHKGIDHIVYSTAYDPTKNVELRAAKQFKIPCESYPEAIGHIMGDYHCISVAGTHGKTTTTALVASILQQAGWDPSAIIGGEVPAFGGNVRTGRSRWLVFEADEYQNKFRYYSPSDMLMLNVEYDHPDFFQTPKSYAEAFQTFARRCPFQGILVMNADDPVLEKIAGTLKRDIVYFGESKKADFQLVHTRWGDGRQRIVIRQNDVQHELSTTLSGKYNALNVLAAVAMCKALGIGWKEIRKAVQRFSGVRRRFERKGEYRGAIVIDDYAHHPTAIKAVVQTARERYPSRRIVVAFQPHTFSRTRALLQEFARALTADMVVLIEIYGSAREKPRGDISSKDMLKFIPSAIHTWYAPSVNGAVNILQNEVKPNDVVLVLGAGDTGKIIDPLLRSSKP